MGQITYKQCVDKAKACLDGVRNYQIEICQLAMTVVTITQGGIGSKKYYTITDFAKDIGMSKNTMSKWLEVYNDVYSKLDVVGNEKEKWQVAYKVNKQLKSERSDINRNAGKTGSQHAKKVQDISEARVKQLEKEIDEKPFIGEFRQSFQQAKYMNTLFTKRDLTIVSDDQMLLMVNVLNSTAKKINEHLKKQADKKAYKYGA